MNGIRPTVGIEFDDKYTNAKNKLEQKKYTPKVIAELKCDLAPLARNLSLSKDVVSFYTRLSQEFIDRGQRGMWIFPTR